MIGPLFRRLAGAALALLLAAPGVAALEAVTLQLKWTHAYQFAGYYAAKELGYYRDAGLDVTIEPARPGAATISDVVEGRAQYGVGNSSLLLARGAGQPVVALAVIFQHSALVLVARRRDGPQSVHDLVGRRVMLEPQADELIAYLRQEKIDPDRLRLAAHSFNPQDLIDGKVDAISAYETNEPYYLEQAGFAYQTYTPRSAGIDFYGDNLFTTEQEISVHPARVKAFRAASLRGWQYAMEHPEQIADLIVAKYSRSHSRAFYLFEAGRMLPLLRPELIEIGYMNPGRWRHIADTYAGLGLLPRDFALRGFLYQAEPAAPELGSLYTVLALLALSCAIALYIYRINLRLARTLAHSKQAEQDLRVSEERHRLLADHASDLIWTMDLDGHFTYISPSVEKLRGYSAAEVMRQAPRERMTPASAAISEAGLSQLVDAIRNGGAPAPEFRAELELPCKHGGTVWTEATVTGMRNGAGQFIGLLGVTRDISERRRTEERIRHMAQHDTLTGLPNRALLSDRLQVALSEARREHSHLAVMFLDLDKFKPVNDTLGHQTGDLLLQQVALRMQACVRQCDSVARIGGDEFALLLRNIERPPQALAVAEKIRRGLGRDFLIEGHLISISASIGVAIFPQHGETEIALSKNADSAMYEAKNAGRDNVKLYQPGA